MKNAGSGNIKWREAGRAKQTANRLERIKKYNNNPIRCKNCGNAIPYERGGGSFCGRSCSITHSNRFRTHTQHTKDKISLSLKPLCAIYFKVCQSCQKLFVAPHKNRIVCGLLCAYIKPHKWTDEQKKKQSVTIKQQFLDGRTVSLKVHRGNIRFIDAKQHFVRSSYEETLALWLIQDGVEYQYEPRRFTLKISGKSKSYTPDFFILGRWIEIKNKYSVIAFQEIASAFADQYPNEHLIILVGNSNTWKVDNVLMKTTVLKSLIA